MELKLSAQAMWELYTQHQHITADYEAWSFGDDADTLARLVLKGTKTATASAHVLYELAGEALPKAGEYSVILDASENALCVIRTERVFVLPFDEVDEQQAWKEGEGDRSLAYWRIVHERFFRNALAAFGISFDEKMLVVCEEFIKVFP